MLLSLFAEHWRAPLTAAHPSWTSHSSAKILIFTRTSADMAKLGVGEERELELLVKAAAMKACGAAAAASVSQQRSICVLQLRGLGCSSTVSDRLKAFLHPVVPVSAGVRSASMPHQRLILLLADMSVVSAAQLNFVRQLVRSYYAPPPPPPPGKTPSPPPPTSCFIEG